MEIPSPGDNPFTLWKSVWNEHDIIEIRAFLEIVIKTFPYNSSLPAQPLIDRPVRQSPNLHAGH